MQLPSIDRATTGPRPSGVDVALPAVAAPTIPVAPVNPVSSTPGVVNQISQDGKAMAAKAAEAVNTSVSDPAQKGSEANTAQKDWTIHRPPVEKQEVPPPEPISKMLLEFLQNMWRASGQAVEATLTENQTQAQVQNAAHAVTAPGEVAKANITYSPTKITKTEDI